MTNKDKIKVREENWAANGYEPLTLHVPELQSTALVHYAIPRNKISL